MSDESAATKGQHKNEKGSGMFQTSSLRSRMRVITNEIEERLATPGMSATALATQIVDFYDFRRDLTHDLEVSGAGKNRHITPSHWVVLFREKVGDELFYHHSKPFEAKDEAMDFLTEKWGPVDDMLLGYLLQEYVHRLDFKRNIDEPSDYNKIIGNVADTINTLRKLHSDERALGYPVNFASEEKFVQYLENKQSDELAIIGNALNKVGVAKRGEEKSLMTESEWHQKEGDAPYPLNDIEPLKIRVSPSQQLFTLMAIEEFLFNVEDEPMLISLANSHSKLHEKHDVDKFRLSLNSKKSPVGAVVGQGDSLKDLVEYMTSTGFDYQPVFDKEGDAGRCIGTLELKNVMLYLQNNGNDFSSFNTTIDATTLRRMNLLSPAPPTLDARLPLHRVGEILYSARNIGCVMVEYVPKLWEEAEQDFLSTHLEKGFHIFTTHDYVMACIHNTRQS
jgi:hypothetical protein